MSLLLDALKKAADDKQKAEQDSPVEETSDSLVTDKEPELELQLSDHVQIKPEGTEELTLDVLDTEVTEQADETPGVIELETVEKNASNGALERELDKQPDPPEKKSYTVSDEALSMLIYKTNRDVKQGKRLIIFSVLLFSLVILASGGVHYYMDMQAEIAALERKHQIAMQSMRSKTNDGKVPVQSEIIRNLVSEAPLDDKVRYAKKRMADTGEQVPQKRQPVVAKGKVKNVAAAVSFQKTNKVDPITEKLDQAWSSYDQGRYGNAKKLYGEVLNSEGNNRDALLGLGAIAVVEKNYVAARDIYMSLLKQDPRDPIAIAAISSLQKDGVNSEADEMFLLDMLRKNPDAPHLNFALGNVYAQQEKWKSAQASYFNAWQSDIENADYIFNIAVSLDQLGKSEQAVNFYKDSLVKSNNKQVSFSRDAVQKRIAELSEL